jgi:hypothetical protein
MRSGSEFGQVDSPIGWVRNTPQQPPWLWWSRNCPLWDGAKIRRKTVALIRDFCENRAAGIDAKRKLACSGSIHRHDPFLTLPNRFRFSKPDLRPNQREMTPLADLWMRLRSLEDGYCACPARMTHR